LSEAVQGPDSVQESQPIRDAAEIKSLGLGGRKIKTIPNSLWTSQHRGRNHQKKHGEVADKSAALVAQVARNENRTGTVPPELVEGGSKNLLEMRTT
jgi:hypothetical protein